MNKIKEIENALQSDDEETRRLALQALHGRPFSEIRDVLFSAMGDNSWRVRKEAVEAFIAADPDEDSIVGLIELLRNEDNAGLRNSAAEAITKLDTRAADYLIRLAGDADADVRKFSIDVMGSIGSRMFLTTLLSALDDADVNVAAAAAEHLGHIGDTAAVPELLRSIISNPSQFFRFSALVALGKLHSHMPVPPEIVMLAEQELLRKSVYECLGSIGDHTGAPILLQGFSARQKSQRRTAITSWYRIFSRSSATARQTMKECISGSEGIEVLPALINCYDPGEPELAEAVTVLIGLVGDARGAGILLAACTNERLAGYALSSLKQLGPEGVDALVDLYPSCDETSRAAICSIFGVLDYRNGSRIVRDSLSDDSPAVRKAAVSATGRLALTDCIPTIVHLLEDPDAEVRFAVVACLRELALHDRENIQRVALQLGSSENPVQRKDAAILYATVGDHNNLALLVKDEDSAVRQTAVTYIGRLRLTSHAALLRIALVDEDPDVRIAAAEAIGEACGPGDIDALVLALGDEDCWVQCAVLKSIARIDNSRIIAAIRGLGQAEGLLMICCLEQLEAVGTDEAMEMIESSLDSNDADVSSLAASILARQGAEWLMANSERLLSHPNDKVRAAWVGIFADLPSQHRHPILQRALQGEKSEQIRLTIINLLENGS